MYDILGFISVVPSMNSSMFTLNDVERAALAVLCGEMFSSRTWIDKRSFRADHPEFRHALDRLRLLRYVHEEKSECYRPTILGLTEVATEDSRDMLARGSRLLEILRQRYTDKNIRKENLYVGDLAIQLNMERAEVEFTLTMLTDVLFLASTGSTADFHNQNSYILPREEVFDYETIDDVVAQVVVWRDQFLNGNQYDRLSFETHAEPRRSTVADPLFSSDVIEAVPEEFRNLLKEIEVARANKLQRLMAMGLRALMDDFMNEQVGDVGSFAVKIRLMAEKRLLNSNQVEIINSALEVGHAAIHRMHVPTDEQCDDVFRIVKHLLHEVYVLHPSAKRLKADTPPRGRKQDV